jgi:hypothetical protein
VRLRFVYQPARGRIAAAIRGRRRKRRPDPSIGIARSDRRRTAVAVTTPVSEVAFSDTDRADLAVTAPVSEGRGARAAVRMALRPDLR